MPPVNYGSNVSVLAAMGPKGIKAAMSVRGPVDGDVFLAYIRKALASKASPRSTRRHG